MSRLKTLEEVYQGRHFEHSTIIYRMLKFTELI